MRKVRKACCAVHAEKPCPLVFSSHPARELVCVSAAVRAPVAELCGVLVGRHHPGHLPLQRRGNLHWHASLPLAGNARVQVGEHQVSVIVVLKQYGGMHVNLAY